MSFWSKPWLDNLKTTGRTEWEYPSMMAQSVALSLGMARKFFPKTELITDTYGKELFCDNIGLKFDNVLTVMDDYEHFPSTLWTASKIVSHSLQKEPYLHIDNDVFLSKEIAKDKSNGGLIVQAKEWIIDQGESGAIEASILRYALKKFPNIPEDLKRKILNFGTQFQFNCGVVGGSDVDFLNYYANYVLKFISDKDNLKVFDLIKTDPNIKYWTLNVFIEQYILAVLSERKNIDCKFLINQYSDGKSIGYSHYLWKTKISHGYRISSACSTNFPKEYVKALQHPIQIGVPEQNTPEKPIRVGVFTHSLNMGGVENWIDLLLCNCPKDKVEFKGICVIPRSSTGKSPLLPSQVVVNKLSQKCKIISSKEFENKIDGMELYEDINDGIKELLKDCDAIIGWGSVDFDYFARKFNGLKIYVAHLTASFAGAKYLQFQSFSRSADIRAGVSINCIPVFNHKDQANVVIIPNAVNKQKCIEKNGREETRKRLGYDEKDIVLGYVGRFSKYKGIFKAIDVMNHLDNSFKFLVVGEGPGKKKFLKKTINNNRIKVVDSTLELGDIYRAIDCFVLLSEEETCSLVLLETISCGVPFITTPNGLSSNLEYFFNTNLKKNIVSKNSTPVEIAKKIEDILKIRDLKNEEKLRQLIDKEFNESVFGQRWADLIVKSYIERKNDGFSS